MTVYEAEAISLFKTPRIGDHLAASPVSLRITDSAGYDVQLPDMSKPIRLTSIVAGTGAQSALCAFWNTTSTEWETEGLSTTTGSGNELVCETTHLTLFAATDEDLTQQVLCYNAVILASDSISKIGQGSWAEGPAAWILWILVCALPCFVSCIALHERKALKANKWEDQYFLTTNVAYKDRDARSESSDGKTPSFENTTSVEVLSNIAPQFLTDCRGIGKKVLEYDMDMSLSLKTELCHFDLKNLTKATEHKPEGSWNVPDGVLAESKRKYDEIKAAGIDRLFIRPNDPTRTGNDRLQASSVQVGGLFRILFLASHPWLALGQFSITVSRPLRAALLCCKLFGSLMIQSFFFEVGGANGIDSDAGCESGYDAGAFFRSALLGLCSAFISSCILHLVFGLHFRRFTYKEAWVDDDRRRQLIWWKFYDAVLLVCLVSYSIFSVFVVMCFLANVSETTADKWLTGTFTVLLHEFIVMPMSLAAVVAGLTAAVVRRYPDLLDELFAETQMEAGMAKPKSPSKIAWEDDSLKPHSTSPAADKLKRPSDSAQGDLPASPVEQFHASWLPMVTPPSSLRSAALVMNSELRTDHMAGQYAHHYPQYAPYPANYVPTPMATAPPQKEPFRSQPRAYPQCLPSIQSEKKNVKPVAASAAPSPAVFMRFNVMSLNLRDEIEKHDGI
eukprot:gnl/TRDRNA2_/TRDRNA2_88055_c0_seq1.p1 gnl/TRDRNA2_/TRDRNA2_88055_c0~~gnl/TRDRNA2_/TRDRNA2_88055_c0_seq1.p1  ORF type:complete len:761 (+),score=99.88 gnl/TRDRNA2_/TRDRNA2_88055_c0_seq1:258-2285(+)